MLLVWGSGKGRSVLGELPEDHACPACGTTAKPVAFIDYSFWHVWYLFSFVTGRDYQKACASCGALSAYDSTEARQHFAADGIPFLKKNGWLVCLAAVFLIAGYTALAGWVHSGRVGAAVAEAREGDMYMADLGRIQNSGYPYGGERIYGIMLLAERQDDGRFLVFTSDEAYGRKSKLRKALAAADIPFSPHKGDPLLLSADDLVDLHGKGILFDVWKRR